MKRNRKISTPAIILLFLVLAIGLIVPSSFNTVYAADIIVDNSAAEFTGTWSTSSYYPHYYSTNYCNNSSGTGADKMRWRPNITTAGNYSVYYWLPDGFTDRATNAPFTVYYNGGSQTYYVNEQPVPGGQWILLGTHNFAVGTSGYVELTDNANGTYVVGDAIRFLSGVTSTPTATPTPTPAATATPTPTASALFFDNFEDGDSNGWSPDNATYWSIVTDGSYRYRGSYDTNETNTLAGNSGWSNYAVEAVIKPNSFTSSGSTGVIARAADTGNYYLFYYSKSAGAFRIIKKSGGAFGSYLVQGSAYTMNAGTEYTIRAEVSGSDLKVYCNGVLQCNATDSSFATGKIGFRSYMCDIKYDNVTVTSIAGPTPPPAGTGNYTVRLDLPKQTIWGLGVEIQSDSIGSGNNGLPTATTSVPHDLVTSERTRFYNDMLKGFRYLRLAGGLYFRGLDAEQKFMQERWPEQCEELQEMIQQSGIEGIDWEYWSPAPYWKSNGNYIGGTIKQFDTAFLTDFGNAIIHDMNYLQQNVGPVVMFGLQNEPNVGAVSYSCCGYDNNQYYNTFKVVAPMIHNAFPSIFIHNESFDGQNGRGSALVKGDSALLPLVDAWTWHRIGYDSNDQITNASMFNSGTSGKYVFNNEFEYLSGGATDWRCINTAQSIMNWFVFENSPTWFWLHALKPTYNSEASGYALGFWRPYDDNDYSKFANIQQGYWDYNKKNWHSIAGFLKYLPWNSVRYQVDEDSVRNDNRILCWTTPAGKLCVAISNRSASSSFTFNINVGTSKTFNGYRYTPNDANLSLGSLGGSTISPTVPAYALEFWIEQ